MSYIAFEKLCRICLKESHFFSNMFIEQIFDGTLLFELINDLLQLDIEFEDDYPQFLCSECYNKISEFELFKRTAHDGKAVLSFPEVSFENDGTESENEADGCDVHVAGHTEMYLVPMKMEDEVFTAGRDPLEVEDENETLVDPLYIEEDISSCGRSSYRGNEMVFKLEAKNESLADPLHIEETISSCGSYSYQGNETVFQVERHPAQSIFEEEEGEMEIGRGRDEFGTDSSSDGDRALSTDGRNSERDRLNAYGGQYGLIQDDNPVTAVVSKELVANGKKGRAQEAGRSPDVKEGPSHADGGQSSKPKAKEKRFFCDNCGYNCDRKDYLAVHSKIHSREPFRCEFCSRTFTRKYNLMCHSKLHGQNEPHACHLCGKTFTKKSSLTNHTKAHERPQEFCCAVCDRIFAVESQLKKHACSHSDERPFVCSVCGKSYKLKQGLKVHATTAHGGERKYSCGVCNKGFHVKGYLKEHLLIHGEERPYSCDVCGKTFKMKTALRTHKVVHGERRCHPCQICSKTFVSLDGLRKHTKRHSVETPKANSERDT